MAAAENVQREPVEPIQIATFWKRLIAFLLDCLVLGFIGLCFVFFLYDQLAAIGQWGRAIGFFVSLIYFGVMESRIGHGQTLGKIALKIKVISRNGVANKVWYGGMDVVLDKMGDQARALEVDAVIYVNTWHQPTGIAWAAPHAHGTAVKILNKNAVDLSKLEGTWH